VRSKARRGRGTVYLDWVPVVRWMRRFSAIEMECYYLNGITVVIN